MPVIELDLSEPWGPQEEEPTSTRRFGPVVVLLVVITLLLSGPWPRSGGALPLAWSSGVLHGFFWLTDDTAYTIEPANDPVAPRVTLTARNLDDGSPRWTTDLTGPLPDSYLQGGQILVSLFPPSPSTPASTALIDTHTSEVKLGYPATAMPLVYLTSEIAVSIDRDPAAGPEPQPPNLEFLATGSDRPHLVVGRDLATGVVRWTRRLPAGTAWSLPGVASGTEGIVAVPSGEEWMITSTPDGLVESWDLLTGGPLSQVKIEPLGPQSYVTALESTVIAYVQARARATVTAYDPRSLERLWQANLPAIYANPFECGELLCLQTERKVWAVGRGGGVVWRTDANRVRPAPPPTRMLVAGFGEQLALLDPRTGAAKPADPTWRVVGMSRIGTQVVLGRPAANNDADIAVLDSVSGIITPVGRVHRFTRATQCLATAAYLACEEGDLLRVWRR